MSTYWAMARDKFGYKEALPTIEYKTRGTSAGLAYLHQNTLKFHATLLRENPDEMLTSTAPHEMAHLVAYRVFGDRGHGKMWRAVMHAFGANPGVAHSMYVTTVVGGTRERYARGCTGFHYLTSRRQRAIAQGQQYSCKQWGQALRHAPETGPVPSSKMLEYAGALPSRLGIPSPPAVRGDFAACRQFIAEHRDKPYPVTEAQKRDDLSPGAYPLELNGDGRALSAWIEQQAGQTGSREKT